MADLTRRKFLTRASLSVAGSGIALATLGKLSLPRMGTRQRQRSASQGPVVAHVRDAAKGEVAVMTASGETVYRDPELVDRLLAVGRE